MLRNQNSKNSNILIVILKLGNFLASTPNNSKSLTFSYFMLVFLLIGVASASYFRKADYMSFIHVKLIVAVFMDATLFVFNCLIVIIASFWKKRAWTIMIKQINKIELHINQRRCYRCLIFSYIFFWVVTIYDAYAWIDIMKFEFLKQYGVEIIQSYMLFHYQYLLYVNLRIILQGYKNVTVSLSSLSYVTDSSLQKIKNDLRLLKNIVELFNEVFGWPFILIILYTSLQILNYVDDSFENGFLYDDNEYDEVIISNVCFLIVTTVCILSIIKVSLYQIFYLGRYRCFNMSM